VELSFMLRFSCSHPQHKKPRVLLTAPIEVASGMPQQQRQPRSFSSGGARRDACRAGRARRRARQRARQRARRQRARLAVRDAARDPPCGSAAAAARTARTTGRCWALHACTCGKWARGAFGRTTP
jgi:hypothetical protein